MTCELGGASAFDEEYGSIGPSAQNPDLRGPLRPSPKECSVNNSSLLGDSGDLFDLFANTHLNSNLEHQSFPGLNVESVSAADPNSHLHHQNPNPVPQPEYYQNSLSDTSYFPILQCLSPYRLEDTSVLLPSQVGQFPSPSFVDGFTNPDETSFPTNFGVISSDLFCNIENIEDSVSHETQDNVRLDAIASALQTTPRCLESVHQAPLSSNRSQSVSPGYESTSQAASLTKAQTSPTPSHPSASSSPPGSGNLICTWPSCGKTFGSTSDYK